MSTQDNLNLQVNNSMMLISFKGKKPQKNEKKIDVIKLEGVGGEQ